MRDTKSKLTIRGEVESDIRSPSLVSTSAPSPMYIPRYNPPADNLGILAESLSRFAPTLAQNYAEDRRKQYEKDFVEGQAARRMEAEKSIDDWNKTVDTVAKDTTKSRGYIDGYMRAHGIATVTRAGQDYLMSMEARRNEFKTDEDFAKATQELFKPLISASNDPHYQKALMEGLESYERQARGSWLKDRYVQGRLQTKDNAAAVLHETVRRGVEDGDLLDPAKVWDNLHEEINRLSKDLNIDRSELTEMAVERVLEYAEQSQNPDLIQSLKYSSVDPETGQTVPSPYSSDKHGLKIMDREAKLRTALANKKHAKDVEARVSFKVNQVNPLIQKGDVGSLKALFKAEQDKPENTRLMTDSEMETAYMGALKNHEHSYYAEQARIAYEGGDMLSPVVQRKFEDSFGNDVDLYELSKQAADADAVETFRLAGVDTGQYLEKREKDFMKARFNGYLPEPYRNQLNGLAGMTGQNDWQEFIKGYEMWQSLKDTSPLLAYGLQNDTVLRYQLYESMLEMGSHTPEEAVGVVNEFGTPEKQKQIQQMLSGYHPQLLAEANDFIDGAKTGAMDVREWLMKHATTLTATARITPDIAMKRAIEAFPTYWSEMDDAYYYHGGRKVVEGFEEAQKWYSQHLANRYKGNKLMEDPEEDDESEYVLVPNPSKANQFEVHRRIGGIVRPIYHPETDQKMYVTWEEIVAGWREDVNKRLSNQKPVKPGKPTPGRGEQGVRNTNINPTIVDFYDTTSKTVKDFYNETFEFLRPKKTQGDPKSLNVKPKK